MEGFNVVSEFLSRSNETDSPIEQMVKKAISQASPDNRFHASLENGSSNSDQSNSSIVGGNQSNGNKAYQDTLLFRQLSKGPTRYHHGTGSGDHPRQPPVHDMNHWKALPNPRSNESYPETVPNSPSGTNSSTATASTSTFSEDSNSNSNHATAKPPQAHAYLPGNGGPPTVFDFNINNVKGYSDHPMTAQHHQRDPRNDAEVQYVLCESPYHSPAPTPQFQKFHNDQNQNYQERQQPYASYTPQNQNTHQNQGFDWSSMNQQGSSWNQNQSQVPNGNSGEVISGIINPILYSTPHAQQQPMAPGGIADNGFPHNQVNMNNNMIQQQCFNGGAPQQHGLQNNGYQQVGPNTNVMQPQMNGVSVIQSQPLSNKDMPPQQIQNNGSQQQACWPNGNGRANPPRYINLDMCSHNGGSPAKQGNWYGHHPPSPFLRFDETKNLSPTTPPYPHMNQRLQTQQYPQASHQMPQNQHHVQAQGQQQNHQDSIKQLNQIWSTPQKKPEPRNSKPNSQRKTQQQVARTPNKDVPKATIHYRPPPQKRPPPAPMVPVTEIIQNNNVRIASIIEEATRTSEAWNTPKDASRPQRYIIVANPSTALQFQNSKHVLKGQLGTPVVRGRGQQIRFKVATPTKPASRPGNPYSHPLEGIALDPEKAHKEIQKLRLIAKVQRSRLMHFAKELETYRTALAMANNNPYKLELVKLYKKNLESQGQAKSDPSEVAESDEGKKTVTVTVSPQK